MEQATIYSANGEAKKNEFDYTSNEKQDITAPLQVILTIQERIDTIKAELKTLEGNLFNRKIELNGYLKSQLDDGEALLVTISSERFVVHKGTASPIISKVVE